ncbi:hypothetical protein G5714_000813 [Onychostoma macrolepis]|uniref:Uncharacterized protein n=1 Tax=Onychostoma macrolepis TaxID=369639 RepID=A0A7J6DHE7_9TELE|nr:hypothetical protein G5714_000813 [Onychostoma macrolepis]
MEGILGDKPSCRPPEILDSFREEDAGSSVDCEELECENINVTAERTPLLPPDTPPPQTFTTLQPPPSHQGRIFSQPVSSPQQNPNIPESQFASPPSLEDN